jgi:hypothetical protein
MFILPYWVDEFPRREHVTTFTRNKAKFTYVLFVLYVGKNSLILNNPDLMLRKSILNKNDAITQHK